MRLVLRPEPGLHAVRTDRGQIERVVLNLSMNARDAMPRGGLVVIETQNVSRRAAARVGEFDVPPGDYVALSVTDTGGGIDAETSSHVFEPFFTTKPPGHGTGLGLATVYGIIKQSGGFIDIQSAVGRGTRVTISLPASQSTAASAATPPRVTERPRGQQ